MVNEALIQKAIADLESQVVPNYARTVKNTALSEQRSRVDIKAK
jgi:hypothetical protein